MASAAGAACTLAVGHRVPPGELPRGAGDRRVRPSSAPRARAKAPTQHKTLMALKRRGRARTERLKPCWTMSGQMSAVVPGRGRRRHSAAAAQHVRYGEPPTKYTEWPRRRRLAAPWKTHFFSVSFVLLQTNSTSEIHISIIQTNSSKPAVCVTHRAAAASPKIFPVFTGEVTRVRYPVLFARYRALREYYLAT